MDKTKTVSDFRLQRNKMWLFYRGVFNLCVSISLSQCFWVYHKVESVLSVKLTVLWQVQDKFNQTDSMFEQQTLVFCDHYLTFCSFKMMMLHLSTGLRHFAFQNVERAKSRKLITVFWNIYHGSIQWLRARKKHEN